MRIKFLLHLSLIICANCFTINAQTKDCGSPEYWQKIRKRDKTAGLDFSKNALRTSNNVAVIPVVVHILHNNIASQNISDAQVASQIEVLNKDFRKQNLDVSKTPAEFSNLVADCGIQFCLAQRDPDGLPTNGITRTYTSKTQFASATNDAKFDNMGGKDAWDTDRYLNIWVVPAVKGTVGLALGYSSFPGDNKAIDGVVIGYKYFGTIGTLPSSNNLGRTATHEVGHWLGLYHTHQDECTGTNANTCNTAGDLVCDTPPQKQTYDCPSIQNTCIEADDKIDMTMNFMGYSDDNCMYMFSTGQKDRIWYHLYNFRSSILKSNACTPPQSLPNNVSLIHLEAESKELCTTSYSPKVRVVNIGLNTINNILLEYGTVESHSNYTWNGSLEAFIADTIMLDNIALSTGINDFYIKVISVNGQADIDTNQNKIVEQIKVLPLTQLPFTEGFENEQSFIQNWDVKDHGGVLRWQRTSLAANSGAHSVYLDNYSGEDNGEIDEIMSPLLNLGKNKVLSFSYAYKMFTELGGAEEYSDTLEILLNVDCLGKYKTIFKGYGENLTTGTPYFTEEVFIPQATEWRHIAVDLSEYEGMIARLVFRNISDIENSMFLDDINLTASPLSTEDAFISDKVKVYPTLAEDHVNVSFAGNYDIAVYNSAGILIDQKPNNTNDVHVDISKFLDHFLIFKITTAQGTQSYKVFKKL